MKGIYYAFINLFKQSTFRIAHFTIIDSANNGTLATWKSESRDF